MTERMPCEFSLVRYVPDVVKGEFANIGVLLREAGPEGPVTVRFTRDWSRVRCIDPDADVALLESLEAEIAQRFEKEQAQRFEKEQAQRFEKEQAERFYKERAQRFETEHALRLEGGVQFTSNARPVLETLEDSLSNSVQLTEMRGTLAESLPAEMEQLLRMYVEPLKVPSIRRRQSGRTAIAAEMRTAFERVGAWRLMRKRIAASLYTQAGDPLKLDCGYRNGRVRMFQAVSLESDVEGAKSLAYSAAALREGVARAEGVELELTAVVERISTVTEEEQYRFGVGVMEREAIRVMTVADLGRIAETAKSELQV